MRRFVQAFAADAVPRVMGDALVAALDGAPQRFNVAVRKPAAVLLDRGAGLVLEDLVWGLVPSWSKAPETAYTTVTARLDRALSSRIYRSAWEERRCVVPMTGYYKWDRTTRPARPYFIQPVTGDVLFAAALWDRWPADAPELHSFSILTAANAAIPAPLVPDGPVFLPAAKVREWIDGPWFAQRFLAGLKQPTLEAYRVSNAIRSRDVDDYTLLEPVDETCIDSARDPLHDDDDWDELLDEGD